MIARLRLATVVVAGALAMADVVAQETPVFRANADAVTVSVAVRRGNRPVAGLVAGDFEITDNGVAQVVSALSYEKLPVDLTVLLDVSGSVSGPVLDQLRVAIADLQRSLLPQDRLRLVTFNMRILRILDLDAPTGSAMAAVAPLQSSGSSAVFDSLAVALAAAGTQDRRQCVVMFSDGKDSASITTPEVLLDTARRTSPTVSIVLATPVQRKPDSVFTDLAAETGGTVISLRSTDTLGSGLHQALDQFRSSYVLSFSPHGVVRSGSHVLDVRVKRAGVDVRARRGYVVP